jgi:hypothetical protein
MTQGAFAQFQDSARDLVDDLETAPGLAADNRLAEQYAQPYAGLQPSALPRAVTDVAPEAVPVTLPASAGFDEAAATNLENEIEAALAKTAAEKQQPPPAKRVYLTAPNPWRTAGLIVGALASLVLVSVVLTLAVRELRQDAMQRRRNYRRRVRRRDAVTPAAASAG